MRTARAVVVDRARDRVRVFVLAALLVAFVVTPLTGAEAVLRPKTLYHERPVQVGPVEPGFPVDFVGVAFDLPAGVDLHDTGAEGRIAIRFRHDGVWGPWQRVEEDGAQAEGMFTGALVSGADADAYQVRGVPAMAAGARAAAINTSDGPLEVVGRRPARSAEAVTTCKSRADWGADESLRTSTRSYAPVQVLTVHHTATSNLDAASDPDGVVRAIYRYHTQTNRWEDIGYQALVAPDGTVYEGRWSGSDSTSCLHGGGDGSDFGHRTSDATSDIVTGAHTGGYNTGNFGVSLLGHFVDAAPSTAARSALVEYLAELAGRHGIDPEGTIAYDNGVNAKTASSIAGHRDYVATECPGGVLYADLPQLRSDVAAAMDGGSEPDPVDAVATGESTTAGSVSGSYLDTHADGGSAERLTEVESGGKPAMRTSLLEHTWTVPVTGGSTVTLYVDAAASASTDGDAFAFSYSIDGGASYVPAFTIPAGGVGVYSASLPATTSGHVRVRVVDTNRIAGSRSLDTLTVDHLYVRTEAGALPPSGGGGGGGGGGEQPATIDLTASAWKDKGSQVVDLAWSGVTGTAVVTRDGQTIFTGTARAYQDRLGAKGGATYAYRVCEQAAPTNCSARVTVTF